MIVTFTSCNSISTICGSSFVNVFTTTLYSAPCVITAVFLGSWQCTDGTRLICEDLHFGGSISSSYCVLCIGVDFFPFGLTALNVMLPLSSSVITFSSSARILINLSCVVLLSVIFCMRFLLVLFMLFCLLPISTPFTFCPLVCLLVNCFGSVVDGINSRSVPFAVSSRDGSSTYMTFGIGMFALVACWCTRRV